MLSKYILIAKKHDNKEFQMLAGNSLKMCVSFEISSTLGKAKLNQVQVDFEAKLGRRGEDHRRYRNFTQNFIHIISTVD